MIDFAILILAAGGFLTSWYIHAKRRAKQPLNCWYDHECNKVFGSRYSHLLGARNEDVGIAYYLCMAAYEAARLAGMGFAATPLAQQVAAFVAAIALFFSMLLFFIQISVIRVICEYCVLGMTFTALIWLALQYAK